MLDAPAAADRETLIARYDDILTGCAAVAADIEQPAVRELAGSFGLVPLLSPLPLLIGLPQSGINVLAIYHSHPRWAAVPSKTDLRENHYGEVPRIIVSLLGPTPEVRAWRLDPDSYAELSWSITPGSF